MTDLPQAKLSAAGGDAAERDALDAEIRGQGFTIHSKADRCSDGCSKCSKARELIRWPAGIPLEKNLAQLPTATLEKLAKHYDIDLSDEGYLHHSAKGSSRTSAQI